MQSWTDRLNRPETPVVKPAPAKAKGIEPGRLMLVPTARQVDSFMRTIPARTQIGIAELKAGLAAQSGAEVTCPVTIGYHLRTVAEAAHEAFERGLPLEDVTPFWRVLNATTPTTGRLTFGTAFVASRRSSEGLDG